MEAQPGNQSEQCNAKGPEYFLYIEKWFYIRALLSTSWLQHPKRKPIHRETQKTLFPSEH